MLVLGKSPRGPVDPADSANLTPQDSNDNRKATVAKGTDSPLKTQEVQTPPPELIEEEEDEQVKVANAQNSISA